MQPAMNHFVIHHSGRCGMSLANSSTKHVCRRTWLKGSACMGGCKYTRCGNIKKNYLESFVSPCFFLEQKKPEATLTVNIFLFFFFSWLYRDDRDGETGRCLRSVCCAGGFSFHGRTPQADRDIWFIHECGPPSRLVTGAAWPSETFTRVLTFLKTRPLN